MDVHSNVVCTFCGCLCDDIEVEVQDNQISKVKRACLIGRNKILHAQSNAPTPSIAGREVSIDEAVDEAGRILAQAQFPLVYGLSSATTEAQKELVEIAEILEGSLDNPSSYCHGPGVMARQQVGLATCTLGEVKNRADLVIFWGCNPMESHMRHLQPVLEPAERLVHPGRSQRSQAGGHRYPSNAHHQGGRPVHPGPAGHDLRDGDGVACLDPGCTPGDPG